MLAVLVCNLCAVVMLGGLITGIVVGFIRARVAIGAALAYDPFAAVTWRAAPLPGRGSWHPA